MSKIKRVGLSKKIRFDVFKRDLFKCAYCGRTPPMVFLEVDHIIPVSKKGTNKIDNLITSCFDCNRGKSNTELNILPESTSEKIVIIKEKELQYKSYQKLLTLIETRIMNECNIIDSIFNLSFPEYRLTDRFKSVSVRKFILELGLNEVKISMNLSCSKIDNYANCIKYFCGICWSKIKYKTNN